MNVKPKVGTAKKIRFYTDTKQGISPTFLLIQLSDYLNLYFLFSNRIAFT